MANYSQRKYRTVHVQTASKKKTFLQKVTAYIKRFI